MDTSKEYILINLDNWCTKNYYQWFNKELVQNLGSLSMEQLWLAFVMSGLYQKVWSGIDWVNK